MLLAELVEFEFEDCLPRFTKYKTIIEIAITAMTIISISFFLDFFGRKSTPNNAAWGDGGVGAAWAGTVGGTGAGAATSGIGGKLRPVGICNGFSGLPRGEPSPGDF